MFAQYSDVWENSSWRKRLEEYRNQLETNDNDVVQQSPVDDPVAWLIKHVDLANNGYSDESKLEGTWQAVTHGDLRSGTLYVAPNNKDDSDSKILCIGEYKRMGPGPILQDFVELEVDILLWLTPAGNDDIQSVRQLMTIMTKTGEIQDAINVNSDHAGIVKTASVVTSLRRLAQDMTSESDIRQYLWGLLFNAVYVALLLRKRGEHAPIRKRAVLLAGLICQRLDQMPKPERLAPPTATSNASPPTPSVTVDRQQLREVLVEKFSLEELDVLCTDVKDNLDKDGFKIDVSIEEIGGKMKTTIIKNLVEYLDRRGYLHYLVAAVRKARPGAIPKDAQR